MMTQRIETSYSIQELAARLSVSDDTIRRRMAELELDLIFVGRLVRIPESEAEKIIKRVKQLGRKKPVK